LAQGSTAYCSGSAGAGALLQAMRLLPRIFAALCALFHVAFASQLRQHAPAANEESDGDTARAFADKASARLRLLSSAAAQVLATPGVEEEPLFGKTLHKVASQLQESATIMQKWGADYARNANANEMAMSLAEQDAAYQVQDLKRQLRAAIEADQEAQLEQPKRLADLTKKVTKLRSQLKHLRAEAHQKAQIAATALISGLWPRPPKNATKAEIGLLMSRKKMKVTSSQVDEENQDHLDQLESRLGSLEKQLQAARSSVASSHWDTVEAQKETEAASK